MRYPRALLDRIVEHALADAPNECCGVVRTRDGVALEVHPLENREASPLRFDVDPLVVGKLADAFEDDGDELGVLYHSHTRSAPEPSQTDANFGALWPGVEWLIVGTAPDQLDDEGRPAVRSFLIGGDQAITEVPVEVDADG